MTDRETLAQIIGAAASYPHADAWYRVADAILASDWLASVRAEAERAGMMRAAGIARRRSRTFAEQSKEAADVADLFAEAWHDAAEAIEAAAPAGETADERQGWRDIASAPKDGTEVLVYVPRRLGAIYAAARNTTGAQWWGRNIGDLKPTHWMPLPTPPAKESRDG